MSIVEVEKNNIEVVMDNPEWWTILPTEEKYQKLRPHFENKEHNKFISGVYGISLGSVARQRDRHNERHGRGRFTNPGAARTKPTVTGPTEQKNYSAITKAAGREVRPMRLDQEKSGAFPTPEESGFSASEIRTLKMLYPQD